MRTSAVAIGLAVLVMAGSARAHFAERTRSLAGFVSRSETVVSGVIEEWTAKRKSGHTEENGIGLLRVEEALKGEARSGSGLRFAVRGNHQPNYRPGERVVLFLNRIPSSDPPSYLSTQNTVERIAMEGTSRVAILEAVREYASIESVHESGARLERLKELTLRLLQSPLTILWQNALLDLSKRSDLPLDRSDVEILKHLTMEEKRPGVLRVGCVAKLEALGSGGNRAAVEALEAIPSSGAAPFVRAFAATALEESGAPSALSALVAALRDSSPAVRRAAADGLGRLRRSDAIEPLTRMAKHDSNRLVQFAALKAIARIGGETAEQAFAELQKTPADGDLPRQIDLARGETEQRAPLTEAP